MVKQMFHVANFVLLRIREILFIRLVTIHALRALSVLPIIARGVARKLMWNSFVGSWFCDFSRLAYNKDWKAFGFIRRSRTWCLMPNRLL